MFSVFRKEWKLYWSVKSTYLIIAALLLTVGICTAVLAPMGGLQFIPVYLTPITLLLLPLTQIWADRRRQSTSFEQLAFSLGVSPTALVLGHFLAALAVFSIPVILLALLPLFLSAMGSFPLGSAYASILGYALLLALVIAMEQTLLTAIPSRKIGAVCACALPLLLYAYHFVITLIPFGETALTVVTAISPIGLFYAFTYGRLPLADLVTLILGTLVCLLGGVLLCKARRGDFFSSAKKKYAMATVAASLVLAFALSIGAALLPNRITTPDVSGSETFVIAAQTKDYLKSLKKDVTLYYLCKGGQKSADHDLRYFLADLAALSPHLQVKIIDSEKNEALLAQYGATKLSDQSLIAVCEDRYLLLDQNDLYHYYNAELQASFTPAQYAYYLSAYTSYLQTQSVGQYGETAVQYGQKLYTSAATVAYFDGCVRLTNAIHYVTTPTVTTAKLYASKDAMDASLNSYLIAQGYFFEDIATLSSIGPDCELLIIHTPKSDITASEAEALSAYLAEGGKVLLVTSCFYPDLPNLHSVTQEYGLNTLSAKNFICEQDKDYYYSAERCDYFLTRIADCEITKDFTDHFVALTAHAIDVTDSPAEGLTVSPLLYTSDSACLMYESGEMDTDSADRYVCGAVAQKGEGTLIWISSPESLSQIGYSLSAGGNFTLIRSALNWMTANAYENVTVPSTLMNIGGLQIGTGGLIALALVLTVALPLAFLVPGLVRVWTRKKR